MGTSCGGRRCPGGWHRSWLGFTKRYTALEDPSQTTFSLIPIAQGRGLWYVDVCIVANTAYLNVAVAGSDCRNTMELAIFYLRRKNEMCSLCFRVTAHCGLLDHDHCGQSRLWYLSTASWGWTALLSWRLYTIPWTPDSSANDKKATSGEYWYEFNWDVVI